MTRTIDVDSQRFRRVLGHLPTGVTVITAHGVDGPVGMAANSVTSVSLDPPLVLFCPAKSSTTWPRLRQAGMVCINVLAADHAELSRRFAAKGADRFAGLDYEYRTAGPALTGAVAWIECRLLEERDAGDHTIVLADVIALETPDSRVPQPLVFFRGNYGSFLDGPGRLPDTMPG